jgi:hypothetical protein
MAERRPDPPDLRASLVDSGWSEPEIQPERVLPAYEDSPRDALVTRVDDQIQARLDAMRQQSESQIEAASQAAQPSSNPPRPSQERTVFDQATPFVSSLPPTQPIEPFVNPYERGPSVREALLKRVTLLGAQLPLWGALAPLLLGTALVAALLGAVLFGSESGSERLGSTPAAAPSGELPPPSAGTSPGAAPELGSSRAPLGGLVERAAAGDPGALGTLEQKKPRELKTDEALALASGRVAAAVGAAKKLRERLASDPGLAKDPHVVLELVKFAQTPETSREALTAMASLPGPIAADLLYEVWTGTAERSGATELAQALLLGKDVRPRASPALAVALDLREAESCEESKKLLARAAETGDKRSFAPLSRLMRRTGCGPGKKQDCYPCLRDQDELLKKAMQAVKFRREPDFLPK